MAAPASATAARTPPFVFRVDELRHDSTIQQRRDTHGWLPPRPYRSNRLRTRGRYLYYRGVLDQPVVAFNQPAGSPPPPNIEHFETWSLYHAHGTIFVVPYDASQRRVANGSQSNTDEGDSPSAESSDEDGDEADEDDADASDWDSLTFNRAPANLPGAAYATYGGSDERQFEQYTDQEPWIREVLPGRYRHRRYGDRRDIRRGGMIGNLPLLIGLIALSGTIAQTEANLTSSMQPGPGGWRAHGRTRERIEQRGVVVRVYSVREQVTNPNAPPTPAQRLRQFERGVYGKIFV